MPPPACAVASVLAATLLRARGYKRECKFPPHASLSSPRHSQPATPDVPACIEANAETAKTVINKAIAANIAITQTAAAREKLLQQYYKP